MMTQRQAIQVWNEWCGCILIREMLKFIGLHMGKITDDETERCHGNDNSITVQQHQSNNAAKFLREMADSLEGTNQEEYDS